MQKQVFSLSNRFSLFLFLYFFDPNKTAFSILKVLKLLIFHMCGGCWENESLNILVNKTQKIRYNIQQSTPKFYKYHFALRITYLAKTREINELYLFYQITIFFHFNFLILCLFILIKIFICCCFYYKLLSIYNFNLHLLLNIYHPKLLHTHIDQLNNFFSRFMGNWGASIAL
jgi:hypothetical protein